MQVTLRPAVASDRAFIEAVYCERESEIVVLDGSDIGWLCVRRDPDGIDIYAIYLLPAAQKRGIGTTLVRAVIGEARASSLPLTVSTAKINPARRLYERLGFVATRESEFKVFMEMR
jgi:GNAT superfamily N-acetyltransferase